jgi:hypothetical protein
MDGWLGHGWASHGSTWHWNITPKTFHVSMGGMFQVLDYQDIKTHVGLFIKTWHVSMVGYISSVTLPKHQNLQQLKVTTFRWWLCFRGSYALRSKIQKEKKIVFCMLLLDMARDLKLYIWAHCVWQYSSHP